MTQSGQNQPQDPQIALQAATHNNSPPVPALPKKTSPLVAILLLLIAMLSLQGGASLAKTLFPVVGPQGVTALRLGIGSILLLLYFRPWRLKMRGGNLRALLMYGLALGCMNYSFYLALRTVPLGIAVALEFTGPLAVAMFSSRRPVDFIWVVLAVTGLLFLLPLGLIDTAGWLTPVFAGVVAYVFFGLAEVTEELGHPFGPTPNGLPLDAMCRTVEISLAPHLGVAPPEPVRPVDYLLT